MANKKRKNQAKKIENKYSYKNFFEEYKCLHFILIGVLLLILATAFVMVIIFSNKFKDFTLIKDFGGWATLISGLLVYIGSTFLGLIVFFNSWQRQKKR